MLWLWLRTLFQSSSAIQGYALLLLGTSVTAAGAMYITADLVLDNVSLSTVQFGRSSAELASLGSAPYSPDAPDTRFRGLRAELADEARRDTTARASALDSSGGFGFSSDTLSVLLDPASRIPSEAPVVQTLPSSGAAGATVTPPPRGPEGSGPVLAPPTVVSTAEPPVFVATPPPPRGTATALPTPSTLPTPVFVPPAPTVVVSLPPPAPPTSAPPVVVSSTPVLAPPAPLEDGGGSIGGGGSSGGGGGGSIGGGGGGSSGGGGGDSSGGGSGSDGGTTGPTGPAPGPAPGPEAPPPAPPPGPSSTAGPALPPVTLPPDEAAPSGPAPEVGIDLRAVPGGAGSDNGTGTGTGHTVFDLIAANLRNPGANFTGPIRIANYGLRPFTYKLTTTGTPVTGTTDNRLFTDEACPTPAQPSRKCGHSLQMTITRVRTSGSNIVYDGPIEVADLDMGLKVLPGTADVIEIKIAMPFTMPPSYTGIASDIVFKWTATEAPQ